MRDLRQGPHHVPVRRRRHRRASRLALPDDRLLQQGALPTASRLGRRDIEGAERSDRRELPGLQQAADARERHPRRWLPVQLGAWREPRPRSPVGLHLQGLRPRAERQLEDAARAQRDEDRGVAASCRVPRGLPSRLEALEGGHPPHARSHDVPCRRRAVGSGRTAMPAGKPWCCASGTGPGPHNKAPA